MDFLCIVLCIMICWVPYILIMALSKSLSRPYPLFLIIILRNTHGAHKPPRPICSWWYTSAHWDRVTHKCFSIVTISGWDNSLSPDWRQPIIWANAGMLLIWHTGTHFSEIVIKLHTFEFKKMHFKISFAKWRPFCFGLNGLMQCHLEHSCIVEKRRFFLNV